MPSLMTADLVSKHRRDRSISSLSVKLLTPDSPNIKAKSHSFNQYMYSALTSYIITGAVCKVVLGMTQ